MAKLHKKETGAIDIGSNKQLEVARKSFYQENYDLSLDFLNANFFESNTNEPVVVLNEAISLACWCYFMKNDMDGGFEFTSSLGGSLNSIRASLIWKEKFRIELTPNKTGNLSKLLDKYPDSGLLIYFCLGSEDGGIREEAKATLLQHINEGEVSSLNKMTMPLQFYCTVLINANDLDEAKRVLELINFEGDHSKYSRMYYHLIRLKEVSQDDLISHNLHIQKNYILEFVESCDELDEIIRGEKTAVKQYDFKALKVIYLSHLNQHQRAIDVMNTEEILASNIDIIPILITCHQHLSNWMAIIDLVDRFPDSEKAIYIEAKVVALKNLNRGDEVAMLEERSSLALGPLKTNERLNKSHQVYYEIQESAKKYLTDGSQSSLNYLLSLDIDLLDTPTQHLLAERLWFCDCKEESYKALKHCVRELKPGIGNTAKLYIRSLLENSEYRKIEQYFTAIGEGLIYKYHDWSELYLEFYGKTKTPRQLQDKLSRAVSVFDTAHLKIRLLNLLLTLNNELGLAGDYVNEWGLDISDDPMEQANYLQHLQSLIPFKTIVDGLYPIYISHGKKPEIQKIAFSIYFGFINQQQIERGLPASYDRVNTKCAVFFEDGSDLLIDFNSNNDNLTLADSPNSPYIKHIIGAACGSTINHKGTNKKIREITDVSTWVARDCAKNLGSIPEYSGVHMFTFNPKEDIGQQLKSYIEGFDGSKEDPYKEVVKHQIPAGISLSGRNGNYISAWTQFNHEYKGACLAVPLGEETKDLEVEQFILDSTAVSSLAVLSNTITSIGKNIYITTGVAIDIDEVLRQPVDIYIDENSVNNLRYLKTKIIDSIQKEDPSNKVLELVNVLDNKTKESILSCYKHENRCLISDDPWVHKLANCLGIKCIYSFTIIQMCMSDEGGDSSIKNELSQSYCSLAKYYLSPSHTPILVVAYLLSGTVNLLYAKQYFDKNLKEVSATKSNASAIITAIGNCDFSLGVESKLSELLKFTLNNIDRKKEMSSLIIGVIHWHLDIFPPYLMLETIKAITRLFDIKGDFTLNAPYSSAYFLEKVTKSLNFEY